MIIRPIPANIVPDVKQCQNKYTKIVAICVIVVFINRFIKQIKHIEKYYFLLLFMIKR